MEKSFYPPTYLDAAATTPLHSVARDAMHPFLTEDFGNPHSNHRFGRKANIAIEEARTNVAKLLNVLPEEVIFTSGASEAITLGIFGYWLANREFGNHLITVKTEHSAVLQTCAFLEQFGVETTFLDTDENGAVDPHKLSEAIRPTTFLTCVMHVNNETGLIQNIDEISNVCTAHGIRFFTDATQAVGHVVTEYSSPNISLITISGHKFGGPKGVGALIKKEGINIEPIIHGGDQERGYRAGTLPTHQIVGFGAIAAYTNENLDKILNLLTAQSENIELFFRKEFDLETLIPSHLRAPHIIPMICKSISGSRLLESPKFKSSFVASTGSACSSGTMINSRVISEIRNNEISERFVRISHTL